MQEYKIEGTYYDDKKNYYIEFIGNNFIFRQKHSPHLAKFSDTVTIGKWYYVQNNYIVLDNYSVLDNKIKILVNEHVGKSKDSLYFYFDSPITNNLNYFNDKICYYLDLLDPFSTIKSPLNVNNKSVSFAKTSGISNLLIGFHINCNYFEIPIVVPYDFIYYKVKNEKSNIYYINFINLDYKFLTYKRLKQDYVKVINNNQILWDGNIYKKHE